MTHSNTHCGSDKKVLTVLTRAETAHRVDRKDKTMGYKMCAVTPKGNPKLTRKT